MTSPPVLPPGVVSDDDSADPEGHPCPVCGRQVLSPQAYFCSGPCRLLAYRRLSQPALPPPQVYQCSRCEQRNLGQPRCPDCNLFCRPLGPGAICSECDQPILFADLLDTAPTI